MELTVPELASLWREKTSLSISLHKNIWYTTANIVFIDYLGDTMVPMCP